MVEVSHVTKTFASHGSIHRAVADVHLEIEEGQFFTLLGPSGCGKTTLLRCLAGLERPDNGDIVINETQVFSAARHINVSPDRRPIGMVFQSYAIWPHMTVFDNVAFPLRHGRTSVDRQSLRNRVEGMLQRVGLGGYAQRWATELSGGQQQRLALARALVHEPKVLLLDEPLSNLDANLRVSLRKELKAFQQSYKVTTVYVTHDQGEALYLSDRIAIMGEGKVQQIGSSPECYYQPFNRYVAEFMGMSNLFAAVVTDTRPLRVHCALGEVACAELSETDIGRDVWIGIRPEEVEMGREDMEGEADNLMQGTIVQVGFCGTVWECDVQVNEAVLHSILPGRSRPSLGQIVTIRIPRTSIRVMGKEIGSADHGEAVGASSTAPSIHELTNEVKLG